MSFTDAHVSRSVDDEEFDLQRKGYAAVVTDPQVLDAIGNRPNHAIAVCFIEWSGSDEQQVIVDRTEIRDGEDAGSFADAMLKPPRAFMKSGSQRTYRWREADSNPRSP